MEPRLHADPAGDHVSGRSADVRRGEVPPRHAPRRSGRAAVARAERSRVRFTMAIIPLPARCGGESAAPLPRSPLRLGQLAVTSRCHWSVAGPASPAGDRQLERHRTVSSRRSRRSSGCRSTSCASGSLSCHARRRADRRYRTASPVPSVELPSEAVVGVVVLSAALKSPVRVTATGRCSGRPGSARSCRRWRWRR